MGKAWEADDKKALTVLLGGLILLVFCAFLGEAWRAGKKTVSIEEEAILTARIKESDPGEKKVNSSAEEFLVDFARRFAGATVEEAADELAVGQERLAAYFSDTVDGKVLYITEQGIEEYPEGIGLAFQSGNLCFYGSFREGRPEGVCTAIRYHGGQVPWYEYSMGLWKEGQMEGLGITGRRFLRTEKEGRPTELWITGYFSKDKLEGQLTFCQADSLGHLQQWEIRAAEGKTCLDERWRFQKEMAQYRLASKEDTHQVFLVPEQELDKVWWENLVRWGG